MKRRRNHYEGVVRDSIIVYIAAGSTNKNLIISVEGIDAVNTKCEPSSFIGSFTADEVEAVDRPVSRHRK